jgi:hypothetical protein
LGTGFFEYEEANQKNGNGYSNIDYHGYDNIQSFAMPDSRYRFEQYAENVTQNKG